MKRFSLLMALALIICTSAYFLSCKKEKVYSCNEDLNNYATMTMAPHQNISRDALAKMGIDTQYAIINSLSPENNARILKEKITLLLNGASISSEDKAHLKKLYDYITHSIYTNKSLDEDTFLNNWKNYAYVKLHWDSQKTELYVHTWLTKTEAREVFTQSNNEGNATIDGRLSCNCDGGYLCETILGKTCQSTSCDKPSWVCGFLWASACTGRCSI